MKHFILLTSLIVTIACTPTVAQRGNMVTTDQTDKLIVGVHTAQDVLRIMGSPTTRAPFDDNLWYYIGQETAKKGILDPKVTQENIVVVKLSETGELLSVEPIDTQRIAIPIERDKTKTHGNEVTAVQQMLGNLGKFNAPEAP